MSRTFEMNKSKHYITTLVGAIVLVSAFTASSACSEVFRLVSTDQPRPNRELDLNGPGTGDL